MSHNETFVFRSYTTPGCKIDKESSSLKQPAEWQMREKNDKWDGKILNCIINHVKQSI